VTGPPLFAAAAVLLLFAAAHEVVRLRSRGGSDAETVAMLLGDRGRAAARAAIRLGLPQRLERAGVAGRFPLWWVLAAKLAGAAWGAVIAAPAASVAPGRLGIVVALGLPAAGFICPDALLERSARRRRERLVAELPDALDLLAVGAATGRSPATGFAELSASGEGPLARELGMAAAEMACGVAQSEAIERLRDRVPGSELAGVAAAIERSRRYGSPLADQLRRQAGSIRRDQRRAVEERAARAAPKIQLVVALVLVPSVLLMIVAGLEANADLLFSGL
jgi:tight adherence protein C